MALLEKQLIVKDSQLPNAGKGLFTTLPIKKAENITEYKGKITTWKEVNHDEGTNGYIMYVTRNKVIDARKATTVLARYANDAKGLQKIKGLNNNCTYENDKNRVYIKAKKDIPAGAELFVDYGKDYWKVIRENMKIDKDKEKKKKK